ncbi:MAG TPA: zinc-ribbon domain-containing protein [Humibacter sp.]|nr:zinc-ribbon domain-containing protein [Humibacter sp.]
MNCAACGAALPDGAMFCGRCGRSVSATAVPRSKVADPRPGDTTVISPSMRRSVLDAAAQQSQDVRHVDPAQDASPDTAAFRTNEQLIVTAEISVLSTESIPPTDDSPAPVPYVLSFSTGERVVVVGAGLLGRRPFAQPGERFDQLVSIADHERSVSKTHLEFGVEAGELWVCDRYSANGTVIIPPAGAPRRCEPGRRYRVPRGGKVEIGDRWFDVR